MMGQPEAPPPSCQFLGLRFRTQASWDNREADGPNGSVGFDMSLEVHKWVGDSKIRVELPADMPFLSNPAIIHAVNFADGRKRRVRQIFSPSNKPSSAFTDRRAARESSRNAID